MIDDFPQMPLSFDDEPDSTDDANFADKPETSALDRERLIEALTLWVELGWLRQIDRHFAVFAMNHDPDADPLVWLAAALVSHQAGRGHVCLSLARTLDAPREVLSLPPLDEFDDPANTLALPSTWLAGVTSQRWRSALAASSLVDDSLVASNPVASDLGADAGQAMTNAATPLVLDAGRLYLRRFWQAESIITRRLRQRLGQPLSVSRNMAERLQALFAGNRREEGEPDWQAIACALALRQRLTVISGGPGTGKTTTVTRLLALLQEQALGGEGRALRIRLAAPTGKAAARLSESIGGAVSRLPVGPEVRNTIPQVAQTLHRLLGARPDTRRFRHHAELPLSLDLLVVDEASMVDLEMMAALLEALPAQARLILIGDKNQLASVEAGSVLGDLCAGAAADAPGGYSPEACGYLASMCGDRLVPGESPSPLTDHIAMLRHSFRFRADSGIGALARTANAGDGPGFRRALHAGFDDLATLDLETSAFEHTVIQGYRELFESIETGTPPDELLKLQGRFQVLCALRRGPWGVEGLNQRMAQALWRQGWIKRYEGWFVGRPVMVTHNDPQLGLYNGDLGLTLADAEGRLRVVFPQGDGVRYVLPSRLDAAATAFAMTVHKSQGSEFEHVALVLPARANPVVTRELIYTGVTRARHRLTLASTHAGMRSAQLEAAIGRRVVRESAIAERLNGLALEHDVSDLDSPEPNQARIEPNKEG